VHLGLDDARSWVVLTEGHDFVWLGHDLRKSPKSDGFAHGFLPPGFFAQMVDAVTVLQTFAKFKNAPR
jgi:hypothetical protein